MKRSFYATQSALPMQSGSDEDSKTCKVFIDLGHTPLDELNFDQLDSFDKQVRVHALRSLIRKFSNLRSDSRNTLFNILILKLRDERDKDVKVLLVLLLEKLAHDPSIDCRSILETLQNELQSDSTKLKYQIYNSIMGILKYKKLDQIDTASFRDTIHSLTLHAIQELSDSHSRIRSAALLLLASLSPINKRIKNLIYENGGPMKNPDFLSDVEIQTVMRNFGHDTDPRVRRTALKAMLLLHQRGSELDPNLYNLTCQCLKDDYEEVRSAALSLIWVLGSLHPRFKLKRSSASESSLAEDAFVKICDMVSDGSVHIRSKACAIMGSFRNISDLVLMQTFSKELMSHLQRKNPSKGLQGKKPKRYYIPTPEGDFDVESDDFRLLDSGACGAFVRGLEDEYHDVRNASIDSICELSMHNLQFSKRARDFLVDMFHDEIDSVRLNAIHSLRKIGTLAKISLDSEQLQITLSVLDDADKKVREATHQMLGVARLKTRDLFPKLMEALLSSMERYPIDRLSIYRCFGQFGKNHGDYIEHFIPSFFNMEPNFAPKEIQADIPKHIGYLILSFNAAIIKPLILRRLPKYAFRHYVYLRDKFPNCFPEIKVPDEVPLPTNKPTAMEVIEEGEILDSVNEITIDTQQFMEQTLAMVGAVKSLYETDNLNGAMSLLRVCSRDLSYISRMTPLFSGKAEFVNMYLESLRVIIEIKKKFRNRNFSVIAVDLAAYLLALSYAMENIFLGVSGHIGYFIVRLRALANIVWLIGALKPIDSDASSPFITQNLIQMFIKRITYIQTQFERKDHDLLDIIELRGKLQRAFEEPTTLNIIPFFSYIEEFSIPESMLGNVFKKTEAKIIQTISSSNKEFVAGFPLRIFIEAEISNISDTSTVGIQVTMPDNRIQHFWPPPSHFIIIRPLQYQLRTHIEISQSPWTETCVIAVMIVRSFKPDLSPLDSFIMRNTNKLANNITVGRITHANTLALSKEPIKISLWPIPSKY
ncbi:hypothetical protein G9A89_022575 [Geosiphon pyriformis]|nr:hypothetical protein G9A89_022575 [Geosiphon pyriformis]